MNEINILVTLNEKHLPPLQVLLTSLRTAHPDEALTVWLLHSGIRPAALETVERQCGRLGMTLRCLTVDRSVFDAAPVTRQYPQEMYYRLLAGCFLPKELDRVLYIDPDILVLNSLRPLWETPLEGRLFAAASHTGKTGLMNNINQVRLGTDCKYFNSGVLLIDLNAARAQVRPQDIFRYAEEKGKALLLPDQDILNALYGDRTLELDDTLWNYDARNYNTYLLRSGGVCDMDWVMRNTGILHFCGKSKPWRPGYVRRFGILYKHYIQLTRRTGAYLGD